MRPVWFLVAAAAGAILLFAYLTSRPAAPASPVPSLAAGTIEQELALGIQAAPRVADEFGGLSRDAAMQDSLDQLGRHLLAGPIAAAAPHPFDFHVLADSANLHAVTLLGGQIFITRGFVRAFGGTELLAAIVAHELGHGIARHAAAMLARTEIRNGVSGAAILANYAPEDIRNRGQSGIKRTIDALAAIRYTESEEVEADSIGAELLRAAGRDPMALAAVIQRVRAQDARSVRRYAESHPISDRRIARLSVVLERQRQLPVAAR